MKKSYEFFLTDAQLKSEINRCEYCEEKPCKEACPADCSPADFIMAVKVGEKSDYRRSAAIIMGSNPLGGICGAVCPDYHCMKACSRKTFDHPINIPAVQATIIQKAKAMDAMPEFRLAEPNGLRIAIIGAGPAGLGAAVYLAQKGYEVAVFEKEKKAGGMCHWIPDDRLNKKILMSDIEWLSRLGSIDFHFGQRIVQPADLLKKEFHAVIVAAGLDTPMRLNIPGAASALTWYEYLRTPKKINVRHQHLIVIGGGAIAADCAVTAASRGADSVAMVCLEKPSEMPLTAHEREMIQRAGIEVIGRTRITEIVIQSKKIRGIRMLPVVLPQGKPFHPSAVTDDRKAEIQFRTCDQVIWAIGSRPSMPVEKHPRIYYAGDIVNGPTTVVEAVAAGKNTAAIVDATLQKTPKPKIPKNTKSRMSLQGRVLEPVSLETDFFGRPVRSPFILSAAPPSDGYDQMKKAYEAGWAGGVMKTVFDNVPIHIPGEYMFAFNSNTYANCDNVSGHPLDRARKESERLIREYPDRLTLVSTGGPVSGNDEADARVWQSNTRKLEEAGVMGIEYSLSCPQGGDGTKGDIVSQDAELTAKIIDWVMQVSHPEIPKLFKLTAAVTSIYPILSAIQEVFRRYPHKKAGVTLANTFPTMAFRKGQKPTWEEGIVVGMSGEGVLPISYLTLANASRFGMTISGNGGPMDYKAAAHFLALGVKNVQFCTIVMKYGYGILHDLTSGLSHLLQERGMKSVNELIGSALPDPITGFMELSPVKKISAVHPDLCEHCGNCTRCPYLAITLDRRKVPMTDPSRCIGCSICAQKCFAGALFMRERTPEEAAMLTEH